MQKKINLPETHLPVGASISGRQENVTVVTHATLCKQFSDLRSGNTLKIREIAADKRTRVIFKRVGYRGILLIDELIGH